jgi:hypothetical protein
MDSTPTAGSPVSTRIAMDEEGNFIARRTDDDGLDEAIGDLVSECGTRSVRIINLKVTMMPPQPTEVAITVPDEAGQKVVAEVAA